MDDRNNDYVFVTFKRLVEKKGFHIRKIDEEDLIHLLKDDYDMKVSLYNLRREYEQIKEDFCIESFVEAVAHTNDDLPEWDESSKRIYPSLFPSDFNFEDHINFPVTETFNMIIVYDSGVGKAWVNEEQLTTWKIDNQALLKAAYANLDKVLDEAILEVDMIENKKLCFFSLEDETMKSVLILSKKLKNKVSAELGWPIIAVIPVRDFCYLFSERDLDFFTGRIGDTVMNEFENSGYPITIEILKCSDEGIKAVGKYEKNGEEAE